MTAQGKKCSLRVVCEAFIFALIHNRLCRNLHMCKFSHLIHTNIITQCSLNLSLGYHTLVSGQSYIGQRQTVEKCIVVVLLLVGIFVQVQSH